MKLERNKNIYQVMDKSIDEINKDLETIDISIGILNLNQKLLNWIAAGFISISAWNTMLYVKNDEMSNCILALVFAALTLKNAKKSKKDDYKIDILYEQKDLLNEVKEIKSKKLTR